MFFDRISTGTLDLYLQLSRGNSSSILCIKIGILYRSNNYFFFFFGSWFWFWRQCNLTLKSMLLSIVFWKGVPSGTTGTNGGCKRLNFRFIFCQDFIKNFSKRSVFLLPNNKMKIIIPLCIFTEIYVSTLRKNTFNRFAFLRYSESYCIILAFTKFQVFIVLSGEVSSNRGKKCKYFKKEQVAILKPWKKFPPCC